MPTTTISELQSLTPTPTISSNTWRTSIKQVKCPCKTSYVPSSHAHLYLSDCASIKFNTYDPAKINSHPGVRSDLFRRPLDKALITDFFGGVAQAEVTPPMEDDFNHEVDEPKTQSPQLSSASAEMPSRVTPSLSPHGSFLPTSFSPDVTQQRTIRLWTGLLLVGGLTTWVFGRSAPRKSIS